mmetsp:Transcript_45169/g.51253  ORF Transcript_45169/g.51253 Transcript_45169/m.51253 type:complete len:85 (+) Transcript_45169:537-791(+)
MKLRSNSKKNKPLLNRWIPKMKNSLKHYIPMKKNNNKKKPQRQHDKRNFTVYRPYHTCNREKPFVFPSSSALLLSISIIRINKN